MHVRCLVPMPGCMGVPAAPFSGAHDLPSTLPHAMPIATPPCRWRGCFWSALCCCPAWYALTPPTLSPMPYLTPLQVEELQLACPVLLPCMVPRGFQDDNLAGIAASEGQGSMWGGGWAEAGEHRSSRVGGERGSTGG